jgi:Ca-activated chloride channel family protein
MLQAPLATLCVNMRYFMFSGQFVWLSLFLLFAALSAPNAFTQTQVHITPTTNVEDRAGSISKPGGYRANVMRVNSDIVLVPVTVVDAANRSVMKLEKNDFRLLENGEEQNLRYFSTEDSPISVGILLDLSFSMKDKMDTVRQALHQFFENSNPDDDYFVIGFSDQPILLSDATHSTASIEDKVTFAVPSGNTALLDAIYMGLTRLQRAHYKRRALVIISDGGDNHSRYAKNEIRRIVEESDVEIYALGIFSKVFKTYEEWEGEHLLTEITEVTGGHTVTISDVNKLSEAAAAISHELRNQYILGYSPSDHARAAQLHKIKVRLTQTVPGPALHVYNKQVYFSRHN